MKVVASDLGRYEQEAWVDNVAIAPAERFVVDVRFDERRRGQAGQPRARDRSHPWRGSSRRRRRSAPSASPRPAATPDHAATFDRLRRNADVAAEIDRYRPQFDRPVDHELSITLRDRQSAVPAEAADEFRIGVSHTRWNGPARCRKWTGWPPGERGAMDPARAARPARENMDIRWRFRVGDVVKLRLVNDRSALHAMQHPIHIHGQRFLVLR